MSVAPLGTVTRNLRGDGWHVQLDLTPQVLSLAIPDEITWEKGEEALASTAGRVSDGFISASMLAVNAKLFDDGLFAAAELAAQRRKVDLLTSLVHVAPVIAAAARLGGLELALSDESLRILQSRARGLLELFWRNGLLPHTLKFLAALGDLDAVRAALDEHGNDFATVNEGFVCACRFKNETVASILLER